jgi:hypothetical protein
MLVVRLESSFENPVKLSYASKLQRAVQKMLGRPDA